MKKTKPIRRKEDNMTFKCDCLTHLVEFCYSHPHKKFPETDLGIMIYDLYNPDTGRKYRKPKLVADVVVSDYPANGKHYKELQRLRKYMQKIERHESLYNQKKVIKKALTLLAKEAKGEVNGKK